MSAYVIADITVTDQERYEDYKILAPLAIAAYVSTWHVVVKLKILRATGNQTE